MNYKKMIKYGLIAAFVTFLFKGILYLLNKPQDTVLDILVLSIVSIVLGKMEIKRIRSEFDIMKSQVQEYSAGKDVDKFLNAHRELREKTESNELKAVIDINMAGAYIDSGDEDRARDILKRVDEKMFDRKNRKNAALNKILLYYKMEDYDIGDRIYDENFDPKKDYKSTLFDIVKVLRFKRGEREGLKMLTEINKNPVNEPYRPIINLAKEICVGANDNK